MMMTQVTTPHGVTISYDEYGSGPPLVLVHGGFSDHITNWQECRSLLSERYTVYAVARRGRGASSATTKHSLLDEAADVATVLRHIGRPANLLGHSYGALCALEAAALYPAGVSRLIVYEAPLASLLVPQTHADLRSMAARQDWDALVDYFMSDILLVPPEEVAAIRSSPFWSVWIQDAAATMNDMEALAAYAFDAHRFRSLAMPVLLMIGSESPRELYVTDALAATLPDAQIVALAAQAHEGMTTAPTLFVETVRAFLGAEVATPAHRP